MIQCGRCESVFFSFCFFSKKSHTTQRHFSHGICAFGSNFLFFRSPFRLTTFGGSFFMSCYTFRTNFSSCSLSPLLLFQMPYHAFQMDCLCVRWNGLQSGSKHVTVYQNDCSLVLVVFSGALELWVSGTFFSSYQRIFDCIFDGIEKKIF